MHPQFEKALDLAKRTGDPLIILDQSSEQSLVVLNLDAYEKLLGNQQVDKEIEEVWVNTADNQTELPLSEELSATADSPVISQPIPKETVAETEQFYFEPVDN